MSTAKSTGKAKVVFCWHMHQPDYRDRLTGEYYFPWTYLHALKDYTDMLVHLEDNPRARVVVNFAPILLEQLDDYQVQIDAYFERSESIRDPMLAALVDPELPEPGNDRYTTLADNCLRAHRDRMIERFPPYAFLVQTLEQSRENPQEQCYLNPQFLADLLMWYHLSWLGENHRRLDKRIQALQKKAGGYNLDDRRELLLVIAEHMRAIKPRYRQLQEQGRIELAMSPYAHPILPLLLDFNSTLEAMPDAPMPEAESYPGGEERARWHLHKGLEVFEAFFGCRPAGCWASEGALSLDTLTLLSECGFTWTATGDSVLHNSLKRENNKAQAPEQLHQNYQFGQAPIQVFFRDDGLSDLIGFQYADWHAEDAVGDLINHLMRIAESSNDPEQCVISIIMDGENAWEYYPENAWYFLEALYRRVSSHPDLEMTTYRDVLSDNRLQAVALPELVAGSWVYGTFSTWIGDTEKNLAWDLLCDAKRCYDDCAADLDEEQKAQAELQLAQCEGSDWFWWFGDYNPADSVRDFDYLYRRHLSNLYRLLQKPIPEVLNQPFSRGSGAPAAGGVMRRGHATEPGGE